MARIDHIDDLRAFTAVARAGSLSLGSWVAMLNRVAPGQGIAIIPNMLRDALRVARVAFHETEGPAIPSGILGSGRANEETPLVMNLLSMSESLSMGRASRPVMPQVASWRRTGEGRRTGGDVAACEHQVRMFFASSRSTSRNACWRRLGSQSRRVVTPIARAESRLATSGARLTARSRFTCISIAI